MTRTVLFFAALLSATTAHASEPCPLQDDAREIEATMSKVVIDGQTFNVRGKASRAEFREMLYSCGELEAARHFESWRDARIATNASAVGGVFVMPVWAGTAAAAAYAGHERSAFSDALGAPAVTVADAE